MYKKVLIDGLTLLPRGAIRVILLVTDALVLLGALACAVLLLFGRSGQEWPDKLPWIFVLLAIAGPTITFFFNLERIKLVVFNSRDVLKIGRAALTVTAAILLGATAVGVDRAIDLSLAVGLIAFAGMVGVRAVAISILSGFRDQLFKRQKVAVFGAGGSGIQLASALRQSPRMRPEFFFDDNPTLHGMEVGGIPVYSPKNMIVEMQRHGVEKLLIALPETARQRQKALVEICDRADIPVQILPSFVDLLAEKRGAVGLRTVGPHDILGRDKVDLETPEIARSYAGRIVMVTGGGGSIGAELCRQLIACRPAKIVVFEQSEFNLYKIHQDLCERLQGVPVDIVACLGSVTDSVRVRHVISTQKVDIILHAAAYKHVPLVEENELEGARNNVIGTKTVADAAVDLGIERFILVSTDKAVRPTNIMGATKRLAELIVQDVQTRAPKTKFAMVRFGNVLGSSGSVLPLFQAQIEAGGPVTVTHPEVCRFFMTVAEASRLVLLAGAFAEGGDVFLWDMGRPQRIMDIAEQLIQLSGRTVKDPVTGEGDIEIRVTGLRPGEKLYEELLIDNDNLCKTPHPKILRAEENRLSEIEIAGILREIQTAVETSNTEKLRTVVSERVDGYHEQAASLEA